jgi:outer membrane receptor protein involved in Fe transport
MKSKMFSMVILLIILMIVSVQLNAQTTGKIAGIVLDANSGEPLAGANILLEGTNLGAAVGLDGSFYIINVSPGKYYLSAQMLGYKTVQIEDLRVSVNRTTTIELELEQAIIEGDVIVVQANKVAIKKDQTGSIRTISSEDMEKLPVENVGDVVSMQVGVVGRHFRGGRADEVSYLVDGIQVDDAYGGEDRNVELETEAIEEIEVVTGTFNAEYGRAMSGIVNQITKDGGDKFSASFKTSLANYITSHDNVFIGLKSGEIRNQDYKFQLSGPIIPDKISFLFNTRYQNNKNHLNGIRRFLVDDFSDFSNPNDFISQHNGDSSYVSMNGSKNISLFGKLSFKMYDNFKIQTIYSFNEDEWGTYRHSFKYIPDGVATAHRTTHMTAISINHTLSKSAFYEAKFSYTDKSGGYYLYKNPEDDRYNHDVFLRGTTETGFFTGGQMKDHSEGDQIDFNTKVDFTWQISKYHNIKAGILYTYHDLDFKGRAIRNEYEGTERDYLLLEYKPKVYPDSSIYSDFVHVKPVEFASYFQDKMEYEDMVLNVGVRVDYFDSKREYPTKRRNPANQLLFGPDSMSSYKKADPQIQVSPRIGVSYLLGPNAQMHFSYGHFFQMPPLYALYVNNSFLIAPSDYSTIMGNSQVKAQKTVQYEIGLKQQLTDAMVLDVSLYYRDMYNLLSAVVVSTYNQIEYGLFSNKDYGNAKGLEIKYDLDYENFYSTINYTLQYTRGNADNPQTTYNRAGTSRDPITKLIPMSWDQRHTLNATVGFSKDNYGIALAGYYNSGSPYTWSPLQESLLSRVNLYENNDHRPSRYTVDLNAFYNLDFYKDTKLKITLSIYNLLDRLNEQWVNSNTGRAYTAIIRDTDLQSHRSDFNKYEDRIQDPSAYEPPRLVKLGFGVSF